MGSGNSFFLFFKLVWKFTVFIWNGIVGVINWILNLSGLRRINKKNELNRGVKTTNYPLSIDELVDSVPGKGNLLISGDDQTGEAAKWRNAIVAHMAKQAFNQQYRVIVLHHGSNDLVGRLEDLLPAGRICYLDESHKQYDPLREYDLEDCSMLLMGGALESVAGNETGQRYLEGILQLFEWGYDCRLHVKALVNTLAKDHAALTQVLSGALDEGQLDQTQYDTIDGNLTGGLAGQYKLKKYLEKLYSQISSFAVKKGVGVEMYSLRKIAAQGKVAVMDLSNVTVPKLALGLIFNEVSELCVKGVKVMLILDEQAFTECEEMLKILEKPTASLRWCISSSDFFAQSQEKKNFNAIVSRSSCNVVMMHKDGESAAAWQGQFGTYQKVDITRSTQRGRFRPNPMTLFPGSQVSEGITQAEKEEPRVKAKEIQDLPLGTVYIQSKNRDAILRTQLDPNNA